MTSWTSMQAKPLGPSGGVPTDTELFLARTKGTLRVFRPWALGLVTALRLIRLGPALVANPSRSLSP